MIDTPLFKQKEWTSSEFGHVVIKEELSSKMPQTWGLGFGLRAKVGVYHAADTVTRMMRTGFLIHLNCATVYWFSNNHTIAQSSSFDSEFVAMK